MKIKVFNVEEPEDMLYLRLLEYKDGVRLVAVDRKGAWVRDLLHLGNCGRLYKFMDVQGLGFVVDPKGKIAERDVYE